MRVLEQAVIAACLVGAVMLAGCGGSGSEGSGETAAAPVEVGVPSTLFVAAAPADAVPLVDAKANAKPGDRIVFEARVGGRRSAFVENRAVFFVADPSLLDCNQLHGDSCKTPWDYCCEPKDSLLKHMATVQVVDDGGQPLKVSLQDEHGLAELKTIRVSGTVASIDDAGNFVVNAESIHVVGG